MADFQMSFTTDTHMNMQFTNVIETGGSVITQDYNQLVNKPIANGVQLKGIVEVTQSISNLEIEELLR